VFNRDTFFVALSQRSRDGGPERNPKFSPAEEVA
jgi:hypothetical protein